MSSKYSNLPDIDNTQPDIYETPDATEEPEVSDDGYILAEEGSEDIVREKISVSSGIDKFNDSVVDATDTDFSDRITRHKKQMYKTYVRKPNPEASEYEFVPRQPAFPETPAQKLRRLMVEVQELNDEVEKNKEDPSLAKVERTDLVSQISNLQNDLVNINQNLGETPLDIRDGSIIKQAELGKRLIHQLESFKNNGVAKTNGTNEKEASTESGPSATSDEKDESKNIVTYELYYSPDTAKVHKLAKTTDLDERITALEKLIGTAHGHNIEDLSPTITNSNVIAAIEKLEQHLQLLTQPRHLEAISRKAKTLTAELERVNELKNKELSNGGVIPFETGEKINYLFNLLEKLDPLMSVAPALVNRLKSLQQLHSEAAIFSDTIKMLASEQSKITDELKSLNDVAEKLETSLSVNDESIQRNIDVVDKRVTDLAERLSKLVANQ
ncbi:5637_t:CDS:2 [Paraglomus brasilianum]|uniref:5637_t:CDS:1 n=1 Tax=Paraglomus brasilianum TaxID=144538 RepID=A0A9N8W5Y3_9GLOM|nr:5637_t:CDS:2 [Paraglomus brasilianum]